MSCSLFCLVYIGFEKWSNHVAHKYAKPARQNDGTEVDFTGLADFQLKVEYHVTMPSPAHLAHLSEVDPSATDSLGRPQPLSCNFICTTATWNHESTVDQPLSWKRRKTFEIWNKSGLKTWPRRPSFRWPFKFRFWQKRRSLWIVESLFIRRITGSAYQFIHFFSFDLWILDLWPHLPWIRRIEAFGHVTCRWFAAGTAARTWISKSEPWLRACFGRDCKCWLHAEQWI